MISPRVCRVVFLAAAATTFVALAPVPHDGPVIDMPAVPRQQAHRALTPSPVLTTKRSNSTSHAPLRPPLRLECATLPLDDERAFVEQSAHHAARPFVDGVVLSLLLSSEDSDANALRVLASGAAPSASKSRRGAMNNDFDDANVAFVYAASSSRSYTLPLILERWAGSVSVSVFLSRTQTSMRGDSAVSTWLSALCDGFSRVEISRRTSMTVALSFVFEDAFPVVKHSWPFSRDGGLIVRRFPLNILRNIALRNAQLLPAVTHAFVTDADMIPSRWASEHLSAQVASLSRTYPRSSLALVIPSFQQHGEAYTMPTRNKTELRLRFPEDKGELTRSVRAFHEHASSRTFVPFRCQAKKPIDLTRSGELMSVGYTPTRHGQWLRGDRAYAISSGALHHYEPYVVVALDDRLPLFSSFFYDRSANYVSWSQQLRDQKYKFLVQPEVFVVHHDHARQRDQGAPVDAKSTVNGSNVPTTPTADASSFHHGLWAALRCVRQNDCSGACAIGTSARKLLRAFVTAVNAEVLSHRALTWYVEPARYRDPRELALFSHCSSRKSKCSFAFCSSSVARNYDSLLNAVAERDAEWVATLSDGSMS